MSVCPNCNFENLSEIKRKVAENELKEYSKLTLKEKVKRYYGNNYNTICNIIMYSMFIGVGFVCGKFRN